MFRWHVMAVAGGLVVGTPLMAQVTMEREEPRAAEERAMEMVWSRRARLGVKVNLQARESDSVGAYVEAVTPGGPAEKAGLKSGDVITKLDGSSLLGGNQRVPEGRSLPGTRLIELAARLAPNDTIDVQYRRGKDMRTAKLVTQADDDTYKVYGPENRAFSFRFDDDHPHPEGLYRQFDRMRIEGDRGGPMKVWVGGALADLELAPLNPDLGQYFGATEGVLVIDAPKDSPLGLKGGDVLLAIDGRKAASPGQAHRILQSYDGEETVKLEVLRNRKKTTVTGKMPQSGDFMKERVPGPGSMQMRRMPMPKGEKTLFEFESPDEVQVLEVRET
ncbi:MAG: PDZ domain-containing protein [Gemmatimonadales bacterium]